VKHVFASDLAKEFGVHKTTVFQAMKRMGAVAHIVNSPSGSGQAVFAYTQEDADRYREQRKPGGPKTPTNGDARADMIKQAADLMDRAAEAALDFACENQRIAAELRRLAADALGVKI
jgi:hypothetical protein